MPKYRYDQVIEITNHIVLVRLVCLRILIIMIVVLILTAIGGAVVMQSFLPIILAVGCPIGIGVYYLIDARIVVVWRNRILSSGLDVSKIQHLLLSIPFPHRDIIKGMVESLPMTTAREETF
ncbi:MAG: hypothetical protein JW795_03605 [Chitinivibrionales bacterium]|nr:hypothetical protein [Chitinivibrionales bacterium]